MVPSEGSWNLGIREMNVLLPEPVDPKIAIFSPGDIVTEILDKTG